MSAAFFKTSDQVGKKEDVSDIISNIAPTDAPFVTSVGTETVNAILYQWQEKSLNAVKVNANNEGADYPAANQLATTMRDNTTQIFMGSAKTSGTADRVATYGRSKEFVLQFKDASKEVKRDYEYAHVGVSQSKTTTDPRKFANVFTQIASGNVNDGSTTPRAFSETILLDTLQTLYTANGDATVCMIRPSDARIVSGFVAVQANSAAARSRVYTASDTKIVNVVKVYMSPWEDDLKFVTNRWLAFGEAHGAALLYNPDSWKRCVLRDWFTKDAPETGDYQAKSIIGEFGLKHKNQSSSAILTYLT